jgi:hypothetical protein
MGVWKAAHTLGTRIQELALGQAVSADSSLCCRKSMGQLELVDIILRLPTTWTVSRSRKIIPPQKSPLTRRPPSSKAGATATVLSERDFWGPLLSLLTKFRNVARIIRSVSLAFVTNGFLAVAGWGRRHRVKGEPEG